MHEKSISKAPTRVWIKIFGGQESMRINADPVPDKQHWLQLAESAQPKTNTNQPAYNKSKTVNKKYHSRRSMKKG
jgi:hypothetical protein